MGFRPWVLVAVGHEESRERLRVTLQRSGTLVRACSSATDALRLLQDPGGSAAIIDSALSDGEGDDLPDKLLADQRAIPLILVTAHYRPERIRNRLLDVLYKPVSASDVMTALERALSRR